MSTTIRIIALLTSLMLAPALLAHGGVYNGPGGIGGPTYGGPTGSGQGGGTTGSGAGTGTRGGTTGSGGGGGGPTGPGMRGPTGARGLGAGGSTARGGRTGRKKSDESFNDWTAWWGLNDDGILNVKKAVRTEVGASHDGDLWLGAEQEIAEVTLRLIRKEILPGLLAALQTDDYFDARSGAVIALGKVATVEDEAVLAAVRETLKDRHHTVREAACVALGLLGTEVVMGDLLAIAQNSARGRRLLGRADVQNRTRGFAATALGFAGMRSPEGLPEPVLQALLTLALDQRAGLDSQVGSALALGLSRASNGAQRMLGILKDFENHPSVRSHVAVALGKQGVVEAKGVLVQCLTDRHAEVARGAAIALGLLTKKEDLSTVKHLTSHAKSNSDLATRNFSMIALGRIGSPAGLAFLERQVTKGVTADRTFAALALGLAVHDGHELSASARHRVLSRLKETRSTSERGAFAISAALMNDQEAIPTLRTILAQDGAQELKGYACVALALLQDRESIQRIRELVAQRGDVELRKNAALSLGLLRDPGAFEVLQKVMIESGGSKAVLGAATVAMGWIGDRRAVSVLTRLLRKKSGVYAHGNTTRAFATVALGFLGDKDEVPLLSYLQRSSNYYAQSPAFAELLSIL